MNHRRKRLVFFSCLLSVMKPRARRVTIAAAALGAVVVGVLLSGCGTIESQSHARFHRELAASEENVETAITTEHHRISSSLPCPDQLVYGGVVNRCALGLKVLTSRDGQAGAALIFGGPFLLVDFCLSAVLDTLILPVTIHQQVIDEQPGHLNDARAEIPTPP